MRLRNKKTSEVIDLDIANIKAQFGGISVIPEPVKLGGDEYVYYSLAELNDDWEDYEPKEPLIKDEKVRKAVRAWAEANGYGKDEVYEFEDFSTGWKSWSLEHKVNGDDNEIHFNGGIDFDKVEHQGYYTIEELCGEEEE